MTLIARKGRVIGKLIKERDEHPLLHMPFEKKQQHMLLVTHVGPDVVDVEIDDIAIIPDYGGAQLQLLNTETFDEDSYYVLNEDDIYCVYREDASESTA